MIRRITCQTDGQGLYEITDEVNSIVRSARINEGLCTLFIQHTSASLIIQENADPSARRDLEGWFDRAVDYNDPHFTHTAEGPDDMPSHIKSVLTGTSLSIPVLEGELVLGTWQGIYVFEHRERKHKRNIVISIIEG